MTKALLIGAAALILSALAAAAQTPAGRPGTAATRARAAEGGEARRSTGLPMRRGTPAPSVRPGGDYVPGAGRMDHQTGGPNPSIPSR